MSSNRTRKNLILAIVGVAQLMDILDMAIVNVALPSIYRQLRFTSLTGLQWVTSAYVLTYGGFLILGGRAADLFGRRRVFLAGTTAFALASLATGAAQDSTTIEISRGLQGLSAAFMSPAALAIVLASFTEKGERNRALGIWGAIGASGAVVGALLGGVITTYLGWRWNFFINLFIAAAVLAAALRFVPADPVRAARTPIDALGALLITGALLLLVYALTQAPSYGWTAARSVVAFAASVGLFATFALHELRTSDRLVSFEIFRVRNLATANVAYLANVAAFAGVFLFPTLYLQNLLRLSPLQTGFAFLPMAAGVGVMATVVSRTAGRLGYKWGMVAGPLVGAAGLALLSRLRVGGSYGHDILPGFVVVGLGVGATMVAATIAATNGAPRDQEGLASALLAAAQQIGFALGYAVLSAVASAATTGYEPTGRAGAARTIAQAQVHGYRVAFVVAAGIAIGCAAFALLFIRRTRSTTVVLKPNPGFGL